VAAPDAVRVVERPAVAVAELPDVAAEPGAAVVASLLVAEAPAVVAGPGAAVAELPAVVAEPDASVVASLRAAAAADLSAATLVAEPHDVPQVAGFHCAAVADPTDVPVIAELLGVGPVAAPVDAAVAAGLLPDWLPAMPEELSHCGLPQEAV